MRGINAPASAWVASECCPGHRSSTGDRYVWPSVVEAVGRASHGVPPSGRRRLPDMPMSGRPLIQVMRVILPIMDTLSLRGVHANGSRSRPLGMPWSGCPVPDLSPCRDRDGCLRRTGGHPKIGVRARRRRPPQRRGFRQGLQHRIRPCSAHRHLHGRVHQLGPGPVRSSRVSEVHELAIVARRHP